MFELSDFLRQEVMPALGCTEPGAVALAVARAREEIGNVDDIRYVKIMISESIYKNGMNVGVPCAFGEKGNAMAAAISLSCGKSAYGLEVLKDCTEDDVSKAKELLAAGKVRLSFIPNKSGVYVDVVIKSDDHEARCVIENAHSNIVLVTKDGSTVYDNTENSTVHKSSLESENKEVKISDVICQLTYLETLKMSLKITEEDVSYILKGIEMNTAIAEYGLQNGSLSGLNVGKTLDSLMKQGVIPDDISFKIRKYTSAASDARMAGAAMPVMSAAGSGNQGLVSILPVAIYGEYISKDDSEIAKAVAISLLTTSFIRSKTGRLTPICGSAIAGGSGAAAGIAYLMGGTFEDCAIAVQWVFANTVGLVCDGAKGTCAQRMGSAAFEAYVAAALAVKGGTPKFSDGIVDLDIDNTVDNVAKLNADVMPNVDPSLIKILNSRGDCKN